MRPKKWRGVLLYLGILAASSAAFGLRTFPSWSASAAGEGTASPTPSATSTPSTPARKPASTSSPAATAVTVTGAPSFTRFGTVQVAVTFRGSQIADVAVVQTPNRDGRSIQIANRAVPTLRDEVIQSQSAQIDTVSGATYTSEGYAQSVQSAIDKHH
jgi:uncharacterized protein with FMN-binding domain